MLNLDTHVLLQAVGGRLSASETRLLRNDRWSISAIVLWEVAKLAQLGRIELDLDDAEVVRTLARVHLWPITREIARASNQPRPQRTARHPRSHVATVAADPARLVKRLTIATRSPLA